MITPKQPRPIITEIWKDVPHCIELFLDYVAGTCQRVASTISSTIKRLLKHN